MTPLERAIEAIERAAADSERKRQERFARETFRFMSFSPEQLGIIVCHAIREPDIDSSMTAEILAEKLQ